MPPRHTVLTPHYPEHLVPAGRGGTTGRRYHDTSVSRVMTCCACTAAFTLHGRYTCVLHSSAFLRDTHLSRRSPSRYWYVAFCCSLCLTALVLSFARLMLFASYNCIGSVQSLPWFLLLFMFISSSSFLLLFPFLFLLLFLLSPFTYAHCRLGGWPSTGSLFAYR